MKRKRVMPPPAMLVFLGFFFLIGVCLLVAGPIIGYERHEFLSTAVRVQGEVVAVEESTRRQRRVRQTGRAPGVIVETGYVPTVRYPVGERTVEVEFPWSRTFRPVGSTPDVLYDPDDPENVIFAENSSGVVLGVLLALFGCSVIGFVCLMAFLLTLPGSRTDRRFRSLRVKSRAFR